VQLGIHFVNFDLPGGAVAIASTLGETARIAEEGGATTFTVYRATCWCGVPRASGPGGRSDP
jgi:hypothetical protein